MKTQTNMEEFVFFVVSNENTFGYVTDTTITKPSLISKMRVLAVNVLKGGDPQHLDKDIMVKSLSMRLATDEDFEDFKVSKAGYEDRPETYVWNKSKNSNE